MSDTIAVKKIRPLEGYGNLRAFVDVTFGPLTICGVRIIQQPGQIAYIHWPQVQDKQGHYYYVIQSDAETKEQVKAAILRAWESRAQ